VNGDVIHSSEGTTQGDPLAMPMYAVATIPLIKQTKNDAKQVWYADDAAAMGKITDLRKWWESMCSLGPSYGYFPKATKICKDNTISSAVKAFENTGVRITSEGRPYLGSPIGTLDYVKSFTESKVQEWQEEIKLLATFGLTQPHAVHSVVLFLNGLIYVGQHRILNNYFYHWKIQSGQPLFQPSQISHLQITVSETFLLCLLDMVVLLLLILLLILEMSMLHLSESLLR